MTEPDAIVQSAALRLQAAAESGRPCEPVRDLLGPFDIALAYRVQQQLTKRRLSGGACVVGRKVGLTSAAVQQQLGVDQPDFGVLFDDMQCPNGGVVAAGRLMQPKVEAEIAFVVSDDLDGEAALDPSRARHVIEYAVAALEIVDSRVRDWDIAITDTVADNASSGLFVLGSTRLGMDEFEPADVEMSLTKDDVVASTGIGRACLGDPLAAFVWLARTAAEFGSPLRAGDVVLSGALGPMVPVTGGSQVRAEFSCLGEVSATFAEKGRDDRD